MSADLKPLPIIAKVLGYGGLLPFVGLSFVVVSGQDLLFLGVSNPAGALLNYAAVIISFIGAVHWGIALGKDEPSTGHYLYSVLPALAAWLLLFLPAQLSLLGMAAMVLSAYWVDRNLLFDQLRSEYQILRLHLTVVVALSLLIAAVAV